MPSDPVADRGLIQRILQNARPEVLQIEHLSER
jgi:hypothetical protein